MTIQIDGNLTFSQALSRTDSKLFNLKQYIDDILSDFIIAQNLSKHSGNICILRRLYDELNNIKESLEEFQEDELSLVILKLIDDEGQEVLDDIIKFNGNEIWEGSLIDSKPNLQIKPKITAKDIDI